MIFKAKGRVLFETGVREDAWNIASDLRRVFVYRTTRLIHIREISFVTKTYQLNHHNFRL